MAVFETWLESDLQKPVNVKRIPGAVFSQDNMANKVGVIVTDGGEPVALTGTVYGYVIIPTGETVEIEGAIEDTNRAFFLMPQDCYVNGHISIVIKLTSGETITTLGACTAYVYKSKTGEEVVPEGTPIPDLSLLMEQIDAALEQVDEVIESIPEDYTNLSNDVESLKSAITEMEHDVDIAPRAVGSNAESVDLDVTDEDGNVILRLANGHIKTKNFDSSEGEDTCVQPTNAENSVDFDFCDSMGNVILRVEDGYIKTKKVDTTNPYELPSYYPTYLDEKCERIRELMADSNGGDAFIFITDQHFNKTTNMNTNNSFKMIRYIAEKCRINKLFSGGDMMNGGSDEYADEFRKAMNGRAYTLCGNHEYLASGKDTDLAYMYTSAFDDEVGNPNRRYFYVDNPKHKIRYICLNSYAEATPPSTDASPGYEQDQLTWLTTEAMVVESDWLVIIFTHKFWQVPNMLSPEINIQTAPKAVLDLIDTTAQTNNLDVIIIQGHTHVDAIRASDEGIPVMITTCDKWKAADPNNTGQEYWLANRVPGTIMEQAFDVCIVDRVSKKMTAVRVGAFNTGSDEEDEELLASGERVINY